MRRFVWLAMLGFVVSLVGAADTRAASCVTACTSLYNVCRIAASTHDKGCRQVCKGSAGGSACTIACRDAKTAAMNACKSSKLDCKTPCKTTDPICGGNCALDTRSCTHDYKTSFKPCLVDCKATLS